MAHVFYDHLIAWEDLDRALLDLDISKEERLEILELVEETLHTEILMVICTYLPREKHEEFIDRFHQAPHDENHLEFLSNHAISDVTIHIRLRSKEVIEELLSHLR